MHRGEMLIVVAEMVLAELCGDVTLLLEEIGDCRRPVGDSVRGTWKADGQQARPERVLSQNEGGATCRAALLSIGISEDRSFFRQAVNVGSSVAHHPKVVGTNVVNADVVTPNNEDVGSASLRRSWNQGSNDR